MKKIQYSEELMKQMELEYNRTNNPQLEKNIILIKEFLANIESLLLCKKEQIQYIDTDRLVCEALTITNDSEGIKKMRRLFKGLKALYYLGNHNSLTTIMKLYTDTRCNQIVRIQAIKTLCLISIDNSEDIIDYLIQVLEDYEKYQSYAKASDPQIDVEKDMSTIYTREIISEILLRLSKMGPKSSRASNTVIKMIKNTNECIQDYAVNVIAKMKDIPPVCVSGLLEALSDPNEHIRKKLIKALSYVDSIQYPDVVNVLIKLVQEDQSKEVIVSAMGSLYELHNKYKIEYPSTSFLTSMLNHEVAQIKFYAYQMLLLRKPADAIDIQNLVEKLDDKNIADYVTYILVSIGPDAVATLVKSQADCSVERQEKIKDILSKIESSKRHCPKKEDSNTLSQVPKENNLIKISP